MSVIDWMVVGIVVSYPLAILGLRAWVTAAVTRRVQHAYDEKLEQLRAELRLSEERTKADLRAKEQEVAALRDGALGGRASRRALVDKRRIEAVDKIWQNVHELAGFKMLAMNMSVLKFSELAKRSPSDPKIREFMKAIGGPVMQMAKMPGDADLQRPFLSPLTWALFSAYRAVLATAFARAKVLESGLQEPEKLISEEPLRKMMLAALPTKADFIRTADVANFYHLLDELEALLLGELTRMLAGDDDDEETVKRAGEIARLAEKVVEHTTEQPAIPGEISP